MNLDIKYLSKNKIQLKHTIPIETPKGRLIKHITVKIRYKRSYNYNNPHRMIPIKPRFKNQLSVNNGIKKKNIQFNYYKKIRIGGNEFDYVLQRIVFNDIKFERDLIINDILKNEEITDHETS